MDRLKQSIYGLCNNSLDCYNSTFVDSSIFIAINHWREL